MEPSSDKFFQTFVAFIAAVHQTTFDYARDVRPADITPVQYEILQYIAVNDAVTVSDIAECLHMSMPNTSRELRKLGEKGLCGKSPVSDDRRRQAVRLTPAGETMMQAVFAQLEARLSEKLQGSSSEERAELERAMQLLMGRLFA